MRIKENLFIINNINIILIKNNNKIIILNRNKYKKQFNLIKELAFV